MPAGDSLFRLLSTYPFAIVVAPKRPPRLPKVLHSSAAAVAASARLPPATLPSALAGLETHSQWRPSLVDGVPTA